MQAGSGRHLDNGSFPLPQQAVKGRNWLAQRAGDLNPDDFSTGSRHHRIHRAFAAVRHRQFHILHLRVNLAESALDGLSHRHRTQALFKRVWGNYHFFQRFHQYSLSCQIKYAKHQRRDGGNGEAYQGFIRQ
ncbi:hypothetical protein D3C80_1315200 [compost metagenome]